MPFLSRGLVRSSRVAIFAVSGMLVSGCAGSLSAPDLLSSAAPAAPATTEQSELAKATEYWGKQHRNDPKNVTAALNYARNLKAQGHKQKAVMVLQDAHMFNQKDYALNSELGRLALELDQLGSAERHLAMAEDPEKPDWRAISARGTVLAKQGRYADAIPVFERAIGIAGEQPSLLNNLALAYAMDGQPEKAEELLKKAKAAGSTDPRLAQNLALVLGLQGRHDDARALAQQLPGDSALNNVAVMQDIVKAQPAAMPDPQPPTAPIATSSAPQPKRTKADARTVAPAKGVAPTLKAAQVEEDPAALVRKLADGADASQVPQGVRPGVIPMPIKR